MNVSRVTDEQYIKWELDGGGYSFNDNAVLYNGRLYDNETAAIREMLKDRTRMAVVSLLSFVIPIIALLYDRR